MYSAARMDCAEFNSLRMYPVGGERIRSLGSVYGHEKIAFGQEEARRIRSHLKKGLAEYALLYSAKDCIRSSLVVEVIRGHKSQCKNASRQILSDFFVHHVAEYVL